jgi:hypothetical protein
MNIPRIYKVSAVNEHGVAIIQDEWVPLSDYQKLEQKLKIATQ